MYQVSRVGCQVRQTSVQAGRSPLPRRPAYGRSEAGPAHDCRQWIRRTEG